MLACHCPTCGQPASLSLASVEHMCCSACGFAGSPPALVRERLERVKATLATVSLKARQLSSGAELTLRMEADQSRGGVHIMLLVLGVLSAAGIVLAVIKHGPTYLPAYGVPLFGMALALALAKVCIVVLRFIGGRLARGIAAAPPLVEGGRSSCRVCGGPLPQPVLSKGCIVRCPYCQSDNVDDPRAMGERAVHLIDEREAEVHGVSRTFDLLAMIGVGLSAAAIPVVWAMGLFSYVTVQRGVKVLLTREGPPRPELRYVLGRIADSIWIPMTVKADGTVTSSHPRWGFAGTRRPVLPVGEALTGFAADSLIGETVSCHEGEEASTWGTVLGVYGDDDSPTNWLRLREHALGRDRPPLGADWLRCEVEHIALLGHHKRPRVEWPAGP